MKLDDWNKQGRDKNARVCSAFDDILDNDGGSDEDFTEDKRSAKLANAVLEQVVAFNRSGDWRKARETFDPAHKPFVPHMEKTPLGLTAVAILGPDRFLVRRGSAGQEGVHVLHLDGDRVETIKDAHAFALSRDRRWLVLATPSGLVVTRELGAAPTKVYPWPDKVPVDPTALETLDIANDGTSIVFASDVVGIWLVQDGRWTHLAPRPGVGDDAMSSGEDEDEDEDDEDDDDDDDEDDDDDGDDDDDDDDGAIRVGSYAELRAQMVGPIGIDRCHAAISPDGKLVAYGWQDASGHHVDRIEGGVLAPIGVVEPRSDYPYHARFTDDSQHILSNSRHMQNGSTVCKAIDELGGEDDDEASPTDEYLRAYGMVLLPGALFGIDEPVAWIGGAGWSHAAPISGGKPVFTQLLGSTLNGFDYDPVSKRAVVASASGMLHVIDPATVAERGRERGYRPRKELYRWIFWDTLDAPIRW